jgi:CHAT domain-containing protein
MAQAKSLNSQGDAAEQRGDLPAAEDNYGQALAISRKLGPDGVIAADSLYGLGKAALQRFDVPNAERYLLPALALRRRLSPDGPGVAAVLNGLGDARRIAEDLAKAKTYYLQALAATRKSQPDGLTSADSLVGLGAIAAFRGENQNAEAFQRRAFEIRQRLAPQSLAVANSLYWSGICCNSQLAKREDSFRQALVIQQKLAPNSLALSATLSRLAFVLLAENDLTSALDYQHRALELQQNLAPNSLLLATSLTQLGQILEQTGDSNAAVQSCRDGLAIRKKLSPESREVAESFISLGEVSFDLGDLVGSDNYFRQAWALKDKLDLVTAARLLEDRGILARQRGDLRKAGDYLQRAFVLREKMDPGGLRLAYTLCELGFLAYQRGELNLAEKYEERALPMFEKLAPDTQYTGSSFYVLGKIARARDDLAQAEQYFRRMLAVHEKRKPGSLDYEVAVKELADVLFRQDKIPEAEQYYRTALAITEKLAPQSVEHAEVLAGLAGIMRLEGQLDNAAHLYEAALNAFDAQIAHLGGSDDLRSDFRARHAAFYADYIDLLVAQNQPQLAFQIQERFRARSLLEMLTLARVDIYQGVDPSLINRKRSLQDALAAKFQSRVRLISEKHTDDQANTANREIDDLLAQSAELEEEIRATSSVYASLTRPQAISVDQVQQLLDGNTLFLEYALGEQHSYVWAITRGSAASYVLPGRGEIQRAATRVYSMLTARNQLSQEPGQLAGNRRQSAQNSEIEEAKKYERAAADLGQMILGPVAGQLAGKRLLIVADGALEYVPFASLSAPGIGATSQPFRPLVLDHEIMNLPSASVWAALRKEAAGRAPAPKALAVFADPVFDKQDSRIVSSGTQEAGNRPPGKQRIALSADRLSRSLADVNGTAHLLRLPYSRLEAEEILAVTPGPKKGTLDFKANRTSVISPTLSQYRIVHFATHGLLDSKRPELSGLVLSMVDQQGRPQDGFLDLVDIYNLKLSADLVVLSACETGLGKQIDGEGLVGLARGFMHAGATSVVASLWKVSDVATAELMKKFYQAMEQQQMSPPAALHAAQITMLKQKRWHSPYYWAAFQVLGEGR